MTGEDKKAKAPKRKAKAKPVQAPPCQHPAASLSVEEKDRVAISCSNCMADVATGDACLAVLLKLIQCMERGMSAEVLGP